MPLENQNSLPPHRRIPLPGLMREIAIVFCGLTMAVIPLALWVAWSRPVFSGVLIICMLAMAVVVILSRFGEDEIAPDGDIEPGKQKLDSEFLQELQRHLPLTHHHRTLSDPRIRRKMAKLRAMIHRAQR